MPERYEKVRVDWDCAKVKGHKTELIRELGTRQAHTPDGQTPHKYVCFCAAVLIISIKIVN